jgi:hypothetical protein
MEEDQTDEREWLQGLISSPISGKAMSSKRFESKQEFSVPLQFLITERFRYSTEWHGESCLEAILEKSENGQADRTAWLLK